jgi:hypothetical protein
LLICVAVFSAVAQADEVDNQDQRQDLLEPVIVSETHGPEGTNVVITIPVDQDAFISSAHADTRYGLWETLRLGYDQNNFQALRFLLQWKIDNIPANAVINNATASIYQTYVTPSGDTLAVQGQYVTAPWSENTVTWNNANYLGGDITQVGDVDGGIGWKSVNVTDIVRTWYSGARPNHGTILTADERDWVNRNRIFSSNQSSRNRPYVTVDYTVACDNVPPVASVNQLPTFSASSFTVTWSGTDYAQSGCTPSGIAYYDVQYKRDQGGWTDFAAQVTFTSQEFTGGANGSTYEFRARAVDNAGNVQSWTGAQAATTVDTQAPNATVNPLPEYTYADNFILTWGGTDNLSGIKNYDLQYKVGDGSWLNAPFNPTTQTSFHATGLQDGVTYYFRARATDNVGNVQSWPPGAQTQTTIILEPISEILPFNPPVLKPTAPITDSFVVRWQGFTAPGTTITRYDIYYQYGGTWTLWDNFSGSETSATFEYQNGDGRYGFEAVATNSIGQTETRNFQAEASIIVDMADVFHVAAILPIILNNSSP